MENSFFSGSENLYKYLVTIGILMVTLSVYYPLNNKEKLELEKIELYHNVVELNRKVKENNSNIKRIAQQKKLNKNDVSDYIAEKKISTENEAIQNETIKKNDIVKSKEKYILYYTIIFWIFFPIGIFLIIFGFINWRISKKVEDQTANLEKRKLELEIQKLEKENESQS